jgi:hypothetical protein
MHKNSYLYYLQLPQDEIADRTLIKDKKRAHRKLHTCTTGKKKKTSHVAINIF